LVAPDKLGTDNSCQKYVLHSGPSVKFNNLTVVSCRRNVCGILLLRRPLHVQQFIDSIRQLRERTFLVAVTESMSCSSSSQGPMQWCFPRHSFLICYPRSLGSRFSLPHTAVDRFRLQHELHFRRLS